MLYPRIEELQARGGGGATCTCDAAGVCVADLALQPSLLEVPLSDVTQHAATAQHRRPVCTTMYTA